MFYEKSADYRYPRSSSATFTLLCDEELFEELSIFRVGKNKSSMPAACAFVRVCACFQLVLLGARISPFVCLSGGMGRGKLTKSHIDFSSQLPLLPPA
jgi:hypothetical protein